MCLLDAVKGQHLGYIDVISMHSVRERKKSGTKSRLYWVGIAYNIHKIYMRRILKFQYQWALDVLSISTTIAIKYSIQKGIVQFIEYADNICQI